MTTNTDGAMPELLPCPFCGDTDIFIEPDERGSGGQWCSPIHVGCTKCQAEQCADEEADAIAAWNRRAAIQQAAGAVPKMPTVPDNMQDWAGMDGTTAWHLIERHADNWADIGKMMGEWLAANSQQPVHLGGGEGGGVPQWQPIETAPKASKAILVHCADRKNTYTVTWARDEEFPWGGKWKHFAGDVINEKPTHWMPLPKSPEAGAGGSVGAIPFVGFVARHADRSKTDTTTSVAVDASREQIQDHLAVADSRRVQASNSRVYTDAQLAAGVEALGICRGMGIPLSDETVAGVVYDYMTAAGPKRPLTIYMDEDPIDVEQFYRAKGFEKLPATPTMTGQEIRDCGWKKQYERQMFIDHGNTGIPFEPIGTTQAVILMDGMRFVSIPAATWGGGR